MGIRIFWRARQDLFAFFALERQNRSSSPSSWLRQQSAGLLHSDYSSPLGSKRKGVGNALQVADDHFPIIAVKHGIVVLLRQSRLLGLREFYKFVAKQSPPAFDYVHIIEHIYLEIYKILGMLYRNLGILHLVICIANIIYKHKNPLCSLSRETQGARFWN